MIEATPRDIEAFLDDLAVMVERDHPQALAAYDLYANEARFGLSVIAVDLQELDAGARILEVGAGLLLLAGYLASLGYRVTALEPMASGFSHFQTLHLAMADTFRSRGLPLALVCEPVEALVIRDRFDYAFSVNVFEHIGDVGEGLARTYKALRPGGKMRIYCPNYAFPYEPHFNIPTVLGKTWTGRLFRKRILDCRGVEHPQETWDGLNWIDVGQVRRALRRNCGAVPRFESEATYRLVERTFVDASFRARRSRLAVAGLSVLRRFGAHRLLRFIPTRFAPVMSFWVRRDDSQGTDALH